MSDEHVLGRFASELHAELHTGSNQKMVGACFQPRPDTPARRVIRIIRSYGHAAAWHCATLPRLPGIEASSLPSPRQGWDSSTEVGIPTSPSKERDTGNAGIPCRNPALNSPQSLIQRASTQVAPVQHNCHLCYLCSHSCRAKPLYALNFNMSEHMSDEHVLGRFASELHAELHAGSSQKMVGACFQPRPDTPARRVIRIIRIIRSYGHTVISPTTKQCPVISATGSIVRRPRY